jgi:hypothetical protein
VHAAEGLQENAVIDVKHCCLADGNTVAASVPSTAALTTHSMPRQVPVLTHMTRMTMTDA